MQVTWADTERILQVPPPPAPDFDSAVAEGFRRLRTDWEFGKHPAEGIAETRMVTPADVTIAPVASPIPPDMAQRLRDAACKICGIPHRRWYLMPETAPEDDQADEAAADEPSGGRAAGAASALASESRRVDPVEDFIDALSRQLDVETAALLAFTQGPTSAEALQVYLAPRQAMFERRIAELQPFADRLSRRLTELLKASDPETYWPPGPAVEPGEEASG